MLFSEAFHLDKNNALGRRLDLELQTTLKMAQLETEIKQTYISDGRFFILIFSNKLEVTDHNDPNHNFFKSQIMHLQVKLISTDCGMSDLLLCLLRSLKEFANLAQVT